MFKTKENDNGDNHIVAGMSPDCLKEWKERYKNVESIEEYLQNACPNDHQQFVRSLAILGNLRFSCEEFKSMYNTIYNWSFEMNNYCDIDGK